VAAARSLPKLKVAVAHPCDATSLGAVVEATELGLIEPILVGPQAGSGPSRRRSARISL
jgi:phosphate acetyltransferase